MKHLQSYNLFENIEDDPISVIKKLNKDKNAKYSLTGEGLIDVEGNVDLYNLNLKELPVKFGIVTGYFYCAYNQLTSLQGSPTKVGEYFDCANNKLTTLQGGPTKVAGDFYCANNKLISLQGGPTKVAGDFYCHSNQLTTLQGCPKEVDGDFYCNNNPLIHIGHLLICKIEGKIYADQKLLDEYYKLRNTEINF